MRVVDGDARHRGESFGAGGGTSVAMVVVGVVDVVVDGLNAEPMVAVTRAPVAAPMVNPQMEALVINFLNIDIFCFGQVFLDAC